MWGYGHGCVPFGLVNVLEIATIFEIVVVKTVDDRRIERVFLESDVMNRNIKRRSIDRD